MRWLRLYDDTINDPKILKLPEAMRWHWIAMLCVASKNEGALPALDDVAIQLRVSTGKATEIISALVKAGLLDRTETGFAPHNWSGRQYKSDVSTERVKRFRQQKRNVSSAVSETPPDTDTDTEKPSLREGSAPARRGTRLPIDWTPDESETQFATQQGLSFEKLRTEALKFRNYWTSKSGKDATKLDWSRTWQNWILNAKGPANGQRTANPRATGHDALLAVATRKAREIIGDGEVAGAASEAEFSFGDGAFGGAARGHHGSAGAASSGHDGRKPDGGTVLEGEVIAPDKASAGLSDGWQRH